MLPIVGVSGDDTISKHQNSIITGWNLYNGRNFVTFTSNVTPSWNSVDLAEDIIFYVNTQYSENLVTGDIMITEYDSVSGSFFTCHYFNPMGWVNVFQIFEGETYFIDIAPGALGVQPRYYELPNTAITSPVTVDLYNGRNYRGFPVTSTVDSGDLAVAIVAYINANYPESIDNNDITITKYDSISGSYTTTMWFPPFGMWVNIFALNPGDGYIVELAPGALSSQPRAYTPT